MPSSSMPREQTRAATPMETSQLEALRERLVQAQRAETAANQELNEFSLKNGANNSAAFAELLAKVQVAREQTKAVYEEWSRIAETFNDAPSTIFQRPLATRLLIEADVDAFDRTRPRRPRTHIFFDTKCPGRCRSQALVLLLPECRRRVTGTRRRPCDTRLSRSASISASTRCAARMKTSMIHSSVTVDCEEQSTETT